MVKVMQGIFISIDGPNGVGKSSFINALSKRFRFPNKLFLTKEPTCTEFGTYVKCNEGNLSGLSYAYLICADRCYHIQKEIAPQLSAGQIVISDRYIESSFVYQGFDGVPLEKIWELNKDFPVPHLSVLLTAEESVIMHRLSERQQLSAFEKRMSRREELRRYIEAKEFLELKGFRYYVCCNNTLDDLEQGITNLLREIDYLYEV